MSGFITQKSVCKNPYAIVLLSLFGFGKGGLLEKGSFQKSPFSRDSREFREFRDSREPPDCGKERRIRPFSRDSREFRDSRDSSSEKTPFVMTPSFRYCRLMQWDVPASIRNLQLRGENRKYVYVSSWRCESWADPSDANPGFSWEKLAMAQWNPSNAWQPRPSCKACLWNSSKPCKIRGNSGHHAKQILEIHANPANSQEIRPSCKTNPRKSP